MSFFRNVVFAATLSGLVAGLLLAALQAFATDPLIRQAEAFEALGPAVAAVHDHGDAAASPHSHEGAAAHQHEFGDEAPADGVRRFSFNLAANVVAGVGFALVLVAASEAAGGIAGWRQGLVWGFAGFAVFTLAPGLGLPPELPAMPAADLAERQIWWAATVAATAAGLALIAFRRSAVFALFGVGLLVAPHLVGAPKPESFETAVPEALHRDFVTAVTVTNLLFWLALGAAAGVVRSRFLGQETAAPAERRFA